MLTGAIGVEALGSDHAGLFTALMKSATWPTAAGPETGEKLWRMPMGPAYDKQIESRFADIKNLVAAPPARSPPRARPLHQRHTMGPPRYRRRCVNSPASETNAGWASGFGVALLDRFVRNSYEA